MKKICNILLIMALCLIYLRGTTQSIKLSVISASGGAIFDSSNTLTWTLGEVVIQNIQNSNNYLSQGFQQPYYRVISFVENITSLFDVKIFPNPSKDILNVFIDSDNEFPVEIVLTDINGKILFQKKENAKVKQYEFTYNSSHLAPALYLLKIINADKNISETYKIQKIH